MRFFSELTANPNFGGEQLIMRVKSWNSLLQNVETAKPY